MAIADSGIQLGVGMGLGVLRAEWDTNPNRFRVEVRLIPEDDGGFSVHAARLRGAWSQGESEEEALENIKEAVAALIAQYEADGEEVPWLPEGDVHEPEPGELKRQVNVDVED